MNNQKVIHLNIPIITTQTKKHNFPKTIRSKISSNFQNPTHFKPVPFPPTPWSLKLSARLDYIPAAIKASRRRTLRRFLCGLPHRPPRESDLPAPFRPSRRHESKSPAAGSGYRSPFRPYFFLSPPISWLGWEDHP